MMTSPWPPQRTVRSPLAPRVAVPQEPVDPARIGRRAVRRRAMGMDADGGAAALEAERFQVPRSRGWRPAGVHSRAGMGFVIIVVPKPDNHEVGRACCWVLSHPAALMKLESLDSDRVADLRPCLDSVPIPRARRGRWYSLTAILLVGACAVVSGARSVNELAERGQRAADTLLKTIGIRRHLLGWRRTPSAATIGRVLGAVDGDALDQAVLVLGVLRLPEPSFPSLLCETVQILQAPGEPWRVRESR